MFKETVSIWTYLQNAAKPVIIYGMGDGAEKILAAFDKYGIKADGFMASDEFVRGHSFCGFEIKKLSDIEEMYDDFIIIVAFGTSRPEVMERLYSLAERYEVYAPEVPVYGGGLFDERYIAENLGKMTEVRKLFADERSRDIFDRLIDYKLNGKIEILKEITSPKEEGMGLLKIKSDGSETFADLGAYTGDTIEEFLKYTDKKFNKIYAIEPDAKNFIKLRRRLYQFGSDKLIPINAAAWDSDGKTEFFNKGGRNSSAGGMGSKKRAAKIVNTCTLSSVCKSDRITIMKIDVEGCEAKALAGAADIIKSRHYPRLVVSVYHRTEDLLELPLLINKLNGRYKMYLRHHDYIPAWDTNLYCI